jgi:hypothetical protein
MMLDLPHILLIFFLLAWGLEAIAVLALMAWVIHRRLRHPGEGKESIHQQISKSVDQ